MDRVPALLELLQLLSQANVNDARTLTTLLFRDQCHIHSKLQASSSTMGVLLHDMARSSGLYRPAHDFTATMSHRSGIIAVTLFLLHF